MPVLITHGHTGSRHAAGRYAPAVMQKLAAARVEARFVEIRNEFGHIGANIDSPGWVPTPAGFLPQVAEG